jgi:stearoyl-CoA desaturase (delta-9 desaturase)
VAGRLTCLIAGRLAIESLVLVWVADHRRPHKYRDKEGDPHSPWRFGTGGKAVAVTA